MNAFSRTALSLLFMLGTALPLAAQSTPIQEDLNPDDFYRRASFGIGLNIGLISGAGISGRGTFPGGFAAQGTFFVMTLGDYTHFNIGGEGQYAFIRETDWRLYSLLGMGYYSSTTKDSSRPGNRIANPFRIGLGLGYEYFTSRQFVISLAGALTYFPTTNEVFPVPEIGFFFYFR